MGNLLVSPVPSYHKQHSTQSQMSSKWHCQSTIIQSVLSLTKQGTSMWRDSSIYKVNGTGKSYINFSPSVERGTPNSLQRGHWLILLHHMGCYLFEQIMHKTVQTLWSSGDCGICVFDNLQMIKSLKFQRGGNRLQVSLVTSRLFLKAMILNLILLLQWPNAKVPLTYSNQRIPLSPGMPKYESITNVSKNVFDGLTVRSNALGIKLRHGLNWRCYHHRSTSFSSSWKQRSMTDSSFNSMIVSWQWNALELILRWGRTVPYIRRWRNFNMLKP